MARVKVLRGPTLRSIFSKSASERSSRAGPSTFSLSSTLATSSLFSPRFFRTQFTTCEVVIAATRAASPVDDRRDI